MNFTFLNLSQVQPHQVLALLVPLVLLPSMLFLFQFLNRTLRHPLGYLLAFVVYWIGWCILVPALLLGGFNSLLDLFTPFPPLNRLDWQTQLLLWWPLIFPLVFVFMPRIGQANFGILLVSMSLGIVIGITEEILWRGVYTRMFAGNFWFAILYPSILFALWHVSPLLVFPSKQPGGNLSFVAYAIVLGLSYALATERTGSIGWSTISHVIHDMLGLGGFIYAAWLTQ